MKSFSLSTLFLAAALASTPAALTDQLVAYWGFEGATQNHPSASGGSAYNGTLMGNAATTGTARVGTGALLLDGTGDYMDVTSIVDVTQPWTVAAWFRPAAAPSGTARAFVFETSGGYGMSFGIREGAATANTGYQLFTDNTPGADANATVALADTATLNTWHHIAAVFTPPTAETAGSIIGYLDGTAQYNLIIPVGDTLTASNGFHIGTYRSANDRWFNGSIDEVAIWNRSLQPAEAVEIHSRGLQSEPLNTLKYNLALTASPASQGTVTGTGVYGPGTPVSVAATPLPGRVFVSWDGDFTGRPASFSLTVNANATATALFTEDLADSDNDGLSNYDEIVVRHTLPNNADTDGDLIPDGDEIGITLTSPIVSDAALVSFVDRNLCPNPHAGAIALGAPEITRDPVSGQVSLFLGLLGSADQLTWQAISLSGPSATITPAADGWDITVPAPSSTVNTYRLLGKKP